MKTALNSHENFMKAPFMIGRHIYVRGLERSDLPHLIPWINDSDVTSLLFTGDRPATIERVTEQWESDLRQGSIPFAVYASGDGEAFLGTAGLYSINWIARSAEFRVFIGDKTVWNRGVGTEATRLMVVYAFEKLNLNRVWLGVNTENLGAVKAYEKAGFVHEGVLRQEQYRNFRYYDVRRMSILRTEYDDRRTGYLEHGRELS